MSYLIVPARRRLTALLAIACALTFCMLSAGTALAAMARSENVAIVPNVFGEGCCVSPLPTGGSVVGVPADSFTQFHFSDLSEGEVNASNLAHFDTVVLYQVNTASLSVAAKQALSEFVTNGGKLIIHDSDATSGNDYAWLPAPAQTGTSCPNCGSTAGTSTVIEEENSTLVSNTPTAPSYVNVSELSGVTDAVGDANVMVTQDPLWFKDIVATNANGDTGAVHTYASVGHGLILYNGYDTDFMGSPEASGVDWLGKLWYLELAQKWDPDELPHKSPVADETAPEITLTTPPEDAVYVKGEAVNASYSCKDNIEPPAPTCEGSNDGHPVASGAPIDTSAVGPHSFDVRSEDKAHNQAMVTHNYSVVYEFGGFFSPIANPPTLNSDEAGRAIPVKFSLAGDQGIDILAPGFPQSRPVDCSEPATVLGPTTSTETAGHSSLQFDPSTGEYTYVWKTSKAWAGSCRELIVMLNDGTTHTALFSFR